MGYCVLFYIVVYPLLLGTFFGVRSVWPKAFRSRAMLRGVIIAALLLLVVMLVVARPQVPSPNRVVKAYYEPVPAGFRVNNPNFFKRTTVGAALFGYGLLIGGLIVVGRSIWAAVRSLSERGMNQNEAARSWWLNVLGVNLLFLSGILVGQHETRGMLEAKKLVLLTEIGAMLATHPFVLALIISGLLTSGCIAAIRGTHRRPSADLSVMSFGMLILWLGLCLMF
jgi:hypothetical protein